MGQNIYPLSSNNEQYIPLDVWETKGYVKQAFNNGTQLATMITGYIKAEKLLNIQVTEDCILSFSTDGMTRDTATEIFLFKNKDYIITIQDNYIDLKGDSAAGTAILNFITQYNTYALDTQLDEG